MFLFAVVIGPMGTDAAELGGRVQRSGGGRVFGQAGRRRRRVEEQFEANDAAELGGRARRRRRRVERLGRRDGVGCGEARALGRVQGGGGVAGGLESRNATAAKTLTPTQRRADREGERGKTIDHRSRLTAI